MPAHTKIDHPTLGEIVLVASDAGLSQVTFTGQRHDRPLEDGSRADPAAPVLRDAVAQLESYLAGELREFDLPLAPSGTPFQQSVWTELVSIPFGQTTSYGAIATSLPMPSAARAVGSAVGRNPIAVIVPCHRVLGSAGALTGYAGGLHRKKHLLELEGILQPTLG
ncbi:MAG: methylated-DNA--[protein]-cysteine S-methyltransferase [Solirubrobacteraceae bacterium]|nr:methylated-DNA--[protein]-cysteine S-methyltransferase [Solirubrobacteraceae bacterium]